MPDEHTLWRKQALGGTPTGALHQNDNAVQAVQCIQAHVLEAASTRRYAKGSMAPGN